MILHIFFDPFIDFGYMRKAIIACCILSFSITPIGGFLMLKRMSLIGDALSHSILPGVAIGYLLSDVSFCIMGIGGFVSGLVIAILSTWISENTILEKDASFSGFCIGSLSLGVVLMSLYGSNIDLLNLLFGSILSVSISNIKYIGITATLTLIILALFYRALVMESFDPDFLKSNSNIWSKSIHVFFLSVVIMNLIASFQITGTLMSVGLMMLPNLSARCWFSCLIRILLLSVCIALLCSWIGLIIAFYLSLPAGPVIILCNSIVFFISIICGKYQGILCYLYQKKKIKIN